MGRPLVEICIESVDDAKAAAGADRLELCQALAVGGLTPSAGVQKEVRSATSLPVMTMIRPRPSGFCYSTSEFSVMRRDVDSAIELGANGVVFGVLTESANIDSSRTAELIRQVRGAGRPVDIVFHRAFDFTPDPFEALEQLIDLGVTRLLTSGQNPTALGGSSVIRELIVRAKGRIEIVPGSGIRPENVRQVISQTGCTQVHASLRAEVSDPTLGSRSIQLGAAGSCDPKFTATDARLVRSLLEVL